MPPYGHGPDQETQETKSPLSPLQNICPPQTRKFLRARGEQEKALARLEVHPCHRLTSTGDANSKLATNLVTTKLNLNYWSLLACLVEEQEETISESHTNLERAMSAIVNGSPPNKVAVHWAQKLHNRKLRQFTFLDLGATSRAASAEEEPDLVDT